MTYRTAGGHPPGPILLTRQVDTHTPALRATTTPSDGSLDRRGGATRRLDPSRLVLVIILLVQLGRGIVLTGSNTAFLDEATYITAGHQLIHAWLYGGPNLHYSTYFSGIPELYPVLSAVLDSLGGLEAVRCASLLFMMATTVLAYLTGRRLFSASAGVIAAGAFVTIAGTQQLGSFATYDALSLMMVAGATWIIVYYTTSKKALPSSGVFLAGPVLVLANAVKYVSLEFDPIVIALVLSLTWERYGRRVALRQTLLFGAVVVALISVILAVAGNTFTQGALTTTLLRQPSYVSRAVVLSVSAEWVGVTAVLAVLGAGLLLWRQAVARRMAVWIQPVAATGILLALAVFVAPLNQFRADTTQSLAKHVTFGAWFATVVIGSLLGKMVSRRHRWSRYAATALVAGLLLSMFAAGVYQSRQLFDEWPTSLPLTQALRPLINETSGPVLIDDAQVEQYYLGNSSNAQRWDNTFDLQYRTAGHQLISGLAAYTKAIQDGYFSLVALNFSSQLAVDTAISRAIHENPHYRYVTKVSAGYLFGKSTYVIWEYSWSA